VQRWKEEQSFRSVHFLDGVDHSLEPWLSAPAGINDRRRDVPAFEQLARELTSEE
jgi:hypothetical protein